MYPSTTTTTVTFRQKRTNERKSHAFDYCNQVAIFKEAAPGIGGRRCGVL